MYIIYIILLYIYNTMIYIMLYVDNDSYKNFGTENDGYPQMAI